MTSDVDVQVLDVLHQPGFGGTGDSRTVRTVGRKKVLDTDGLTSGGPYVDKEGGRVQDVVQDGRIVKMFAAIPAKDPDFKEPSFDDVFGLDCDFGRHLEVPSLRQSTRRRTWTGPESSRGGRSAII